VIDAVDIALVTALQADATLATLAPGRVHWGSAPEGVALPCVIVTLQLGESVDEQGGTAHTRDRYQVKVLDRASTKTAASAAASRVDVLLNGQPLTISGRAHMVTVGRDRFALPPERIGSDLWQHVGRDYEVWSDPTP
jgi:hypothetical protein